jgi:glucose-1-phosphate cytidylyltransferase
MKVVLFCGGMGMRLREFSDVIPKPMVNIGYRPVLWNIMKYYAHFGHKQFILCLGYKADVIKDYFVNYHEYVSNDFVLHKGGRKLKLINSDIDDWEITFVDTGVTSNIGQRLLKVKKYLKGEEMFFANYSDGLTDLNLDAMVEEFNQQKDMVASFMVYQPTQSFHVVKLDDQGIVKSINHIGASGLHINAGYFIMRSEFFKYIKDGEEIVNEPFQRLINERRLMSYPYKGFWASMDTYKEKMTLDDLYSKGNTPWEVWKNSNT